MTALAKKKQALGPVLRKGLLALLIGLSFGLYMTLQAGSTVFAWILAGVQALSMVVLIWLG